MQNAKARDEDQDTKRKTPSATLWSAKQEPVAQSMSSGKVAQPMKRGP
ncbi:MAG: hypothetical protein ACI8QS_002474 [Planctomycetota bacterium]|jgi:hypothetical protein